MVWKTHIQLMNISLSFLYFPKLMIYRWMGVVITILLKNHTRSLLQRRLHMLSSHLFSSGNLISSPSDILVCTRCIFLRSRKERMKMALGGWEFKFVGLWIFSFQLVFCYWWSSDNNVCIHIEQFAFSNRIHLGWTNTCQNGSVWVWASVGSTLTRCQDYKLHNSR